MASGPSVPAPLQSDLPHSVIEHQASGDALPIRAYKLGKKRWSYNQVELRLSRAPGGRTSQTAAVASALHVGGVVFAEEHKDSAVAFLIQLESGAKLQARVYLCFGDPAPTGAAGGSGRASRPEPSAGSGSSQQYSWNLVTRAHCCKGCDGPVLRAIQRFGRLGKRARGTSEATPAPAEGSAASVKKDPRHMYLSFDEACTHVGARAFRLVAGLYTHGGGRLLGTAVSPPIRVLSNNDVPTGAARIPLEATLPADWEGWAAEGGAAGRGRAAPPASRGARGGAGATPRKIVLRGVPRTPSITSFRAPLSPRMPPLALAPPDSVHVEERRCGSGSGGSQVARQLLLPPSPPAPVPPPAPPGLVASGSGGFGCAAAGCFHSPAGMQAGPVLQAAPAMVALCGGDAAAMQHEAERQLLLLQQLEAYVAAMSQPASSCCHGAGGRAIEQAAIRSPSLQHQVARSAPHLPGNPYAAGNPGAALLAVLPPLPSLPLPAATLPPPYALPPAGTLQGMGEHELLPLGGSLSSMSANDGLLAGSDSGLEPPEFGSLYCGMMEAEDSDKMALLEVSGLLNDDLEMLC